MISDCVWRILAGFVSWLFAVRDGDGIRLWKFNFSLGNEAGHHADATEALSQREVVTLAGVQRGQHSPAIVPPGLARSNTCFLVQGQALINL
ncbi:MAG TPA: hypothetical protein VGM05_24170 [Planctomycetaceae bacterium]